VKRNLIPLFLILIATSAFAQFESYGTLGAGSFIEKAEKPALSYWFGIDVPAYRDTTLGFETSNRTGFFTASREGGKLQGASSFFVTKKTLGLWSSTSFYGAFGGGVLYQIKDENDNLNTTIKLEFGLNIYKKLGLAAGVDFIPRDGNDQYFVYGQVDLTPKLLGNK